MEASRVEVVVDALARAWNGEPALAFEIFHPAFVNHSKWLSIPPGPQGIHDLIVQMRATFPDLQCIVEDWFHMDGKISGRVQFVGTQQGPYGEIPPTGKRCVWNANTIYHLQDGLIKDEWSIAEEVLLLHQLGVDARTPAEKRLSAAQEELLGE